MNCDLISRQRTPLMGLAMLSILFFHFTEDCAVNAIHFTGIVKWYKTYIGSSGVDLFLFLSGLGLYYAMKKNSDILRFYKRRLVRILVPYALVAVPTWLLIDVLWEQKGVRGFACDLSFLSFFTEGTKLYWYIGAILVCYLIYPLLFALVEKCDRSVKLWGLCILLCVALTASAKALAVFNSDLFSNVEVGLLRVTPFLIGCFYGRASYEKRHGYWLWGVIAVISLTLLTQVSNIDSPFFDRYVLAAANISVSACIAVLLDQLQKDNWLLRFIGWFGTHSLEIYLCHVSIRRLMNMRGFHPCFVRYEFVMLILAMACAWLLHYVTSRNCIGS